MSFCALDHETENAALAALASHISRAVRTLLVIDVVESTRLSEQNEEGAVQRWLALIRQIGNQILPQHHGRMVKDLGDGALFTFEAPLPAVSAAFAMQQVANRGNDGLPPDQHMLLRIGIDVGDVFLNQENVFGRSAIIAQRLSTLAGPGETVVSAAVREQITPMLDADIEDLGACFVKHLTQPLRAYRIGPPGRHRLLPRWGAFGEMTPAIAVVPFFTHDSDPVHCLVGEVLAEEIIRGVAGSPGLSVISRLSTTAFRGRDATTVEIGAYLNADYVLTGIYQVDDARLRLDAELTDTRSGRILWTQRLTGSVETIIGGEQQFITELISKVSISVMWRELQRARSQPLPTLQGYTLLMAAITLMHRLTVEDFEEARHLLEILLERSKRQPIPQAWLGKWHVLRVHQGWSPNEAYDARMALRCTQQALDADPSCAFALTVDGLAHTNLLKRFDIAQERYDLALQENPNDALAWLLRGTMYAFMGEGQRAVDETQQALMLSPLDPHRYLYDCCAASAYIAAEQYERGLELAKRSLRANRTHTSTLRTLAIAQAHLGLGTEARKTVQALLELEPGLTISRWLERSPAAQFPVGKYSADALRSAGVPE